ncbi:MAG: ABC transporter ATP-binding protein [Terriglobales bacterium]
MPVIEARGLYKFYGHKLAVADLTLEIAAGEIFGFLGPNGAGKSTSVKMLLGLVRPSGGQAAVLGRPLGDVAVRARIGFLPEHFRFYEWLTAAELLELHGRLAGLDRRVVRQRSAVWLERVGLAAQARQRLGEFSKGMRQRLGLAQALLHDPELVFLDEPTSGLDPGGRLLVREILRQQRQRGAAVFLNSHLLGEVESTCDRVAFLRDGEIRAVRRLVQGSPAAEGSGLAVTVRARGLNADILAGLAPWARVLEWAGEELRLEARGEEDLPAVVRYLTARGAAIYAFAPRRTTLEEAFVAIVGGEAGQ